MDRRIITAIALSLLAVAAPLAHADVGHVDTRDDMLFNPPGLAPEAAPAKPVATTWYGWQILLADIAVLATVEQTGGYGLVLGGPAVHALNGQGKRAWQSFGLRLGLPFAGALAGAVLYNDRSDCDYDDCDGMGAVVAVALGAAAGWVTAAIVDAAYLARKPKRTVERRMAKLPVRPSMRMVKGGAILGVGSTF